MPNPPSLPDGRVIRHYRRKNGNRSVAVIAGLCGISERYLHLVEAGQRMPSVEVLTRLAAELGVSVAAFFSEEPIEEPAVAHTAAPGVARALMGAGPVLDTGLATSAQLREKVEQAWRIWQSSQRRFTEAARILPGLIAEVEEAARTRYGTQPAGPGHGRESSEAGPAHFPTPGQRTGRAAPTRVIPNV